MPTKDTKVPGIKRLGADRFLVVVTWKDRKTGRRVKREAIEATFEAAVAKRKELRALTRTKTTRERFRDYGERWLKNHAEGIEPSTLERYITALARLNLAFGDHFVDAIEPRDVRTWVKTSARDFEPTTVNGWLRVLRIALDEAVDSGALRVNPARRTPALPEPKTRGARAVALSPVSFRAFLVAVEALAAKKTISPDIARMLVAFAWTGCRSGELRALRWDDWRDGELHIERAVWRRNEKATKTEDPRVLPVVAPLEAVLSAQRAWLLGTQHPGLVSGLVFPASPRHAAAGATRRKVSEVSWFRSGSSFTRPLERAAELAGLPRLSPHALRRTFEKLLRKAEVDRMVRKGLAGWSTDDAQAIYTDIDREDRTAAGDAVLRLVKAGGNT